MARASERCLACVCPRACRMFETCRGVRSRLHVQACAYFLGSGGNRCACGLGAGRRRRSEASASGCLFDRRDARAHKGQIARPRAMMRIARRCVARLSAIRCRIVEWRCCPMRHVLVFGTLAQHARARAMPSSTSRTPSLPALSWGLGTRLAHGVTGA